MSVKRWPYDWQTPLGYLVSWIAECAGIIAIMSTTTSFLGIIIGSNLLFIVISEDILNDAIAFNKRVEILRGKDRNRSELIVSRFRNIVQHYMDTKQ